MIDPSEQANRRIELLKKEREKYDPNDLNDSRWYDLTVKISQLKRSIERWERMKKEGVKF